MLQNIKNHNKFSNKFLQPFFKQNQDCLILKEKIRDFADPSLNAWSGSDHQVPLKPWLKILVVFEKNLEMSTNSTNLLLPISLALNIGFF